MKIGSLIKQVAEYLTKYVSDIRIVRNAQNIIINLRNLGLVDDYKLKPETLFDGKTKKAREDNRRLAVHRFYALFANIDTNLFNFTISPPNAKGIQFVSVRNPDDLRFELKRIVIDSNAFTASPQGETKIETPLSSDFVRLRF